MRTCVTCRHSAGPPLHCRLMPPSVIDAGTSNFPLVAERFWCGQHVFSPVRWLLKWTNKAIAALERKQQS